MDKQDTINNPDDSSSNVVRSTAVSTGSNIVSEAVANQTSHQDEVLAVTTIRGPQTAGLLSGTRNNHSYESLPSDLSSTSVGSTNRCHRESRDNDEEHPSGNDEDDDNNSNLSDLRLRNMSPDSAYRIPPAPPSTPASNPSTISLSCETIADYLSGGPPTNASSITTPFSPPFQFGGNVVNYGRFKHQYIYDGGQRTPSLPNHDDCSNYGSQVVAPRAASMATAATPKPTNQYENSGVVNDTATSATPKAPRTAPSVPLPEDFSKWSVGNRYELVRILGRGSYGEVAQAIDLQKTKDSTNGDVTYVAIKRIQSPFQQQLDAIRLYREIHILRRMKEGGEEPTKNCSSNKSNSTSRPSRHHDCIIQLLDVVQPAGLNDFHELYLVFEYVDTDLYKLIMSPQYLTTEHIQMFLYQMLAAANYLHSFNVIHRDLKPANILLNEDCSLKICDFGLARIVGSDKMSSSKANNIEPAAKKARPNPTFPPMPKANLTRQLTKHVVTRWYRAPELILIQPYTSAVDIWSLGCIFAELLSMQEMNVPGYEDRKPLFPGGTCFPLSGDGDSIKADERLDQLSVIFSVIGTPSKEDIDATGKASEYVNAIPRTEGKAYETLYPAADPNAIDLLRKMLQFNPSRRVTAEEALEHDFFKGVRRQELERRSDCPLECPDFLESDVVDLKLLKQRTYEEVLWYRDHDEGDVSTHR